MGYGEPTIGIGTAAALTALKPTPSEPLGAGKPAAGIGTEDALTTLKPASSATLGAVGPVGTDIVFGITVHVVLEQQTNISAACDLETLGISFHSETREGVSQA